MSTIIHRAVMNKVIISCITILLMLVGCEQQGGHSTVYADNTDSLRAAIKKVNKTSLVILGNLQDGGAPHIGCQRERCQDLFDNPDPRQKVVSLGLVDASSNKRYLFEATPDLPQQIKLLKGYGGAQDSEVPDGIFLTHAHIGHYTGLMYFGKEAMNADKVNVYAMPKMETFLRNNGPWSQLVNLQNIAIKPLQHEQRLRLSKELTVMPFVVPHRDEYSETVGYKIIGPNKAALFIPDIDKWSKWDKDIIKEMEKVDYALVDATFYSGEELNHRDISQIPHPFIIETMRQFSALPEKEKKKVIFIHFNHTNPVIDADSEATKEVQRQGFNIARFQDVIEL